MHMIEERKSKSDNQSARFKGLKSSQNNKISISHLKLVIIQLFDPIGFPSTISSQ